MAFGFEIRLTDIVSYTLNFNLIGMHDRDNSNYSYQARTFTTDLSARF